MHELIERLHPRRGSAVVRLEVHNRGDHAKGANEQGILYILTLLHVNRFEYIDGAWVKIKGLLPMAFGGGSLDEVVQLAMNFINDCPEAVNSL